MKSNLDLIKEFSRKTGITDPAIDTYLETQEDYLEESVASFRKKIGVNDPKIDYYIERVTFRRPWFFGTDYGSYAGTATSNTQQETQSWFAGWWKKWHETQNRSWQEADDMVDAEWRIVRREKRVVDNPKLQITFKGITPWS
jgi:hypothetical protein